MEWKVMLQVDQEVSVCVCVEHLSILHGHTVELEDKLLV